MEEDHVFGPFLDLVPVNGVNWSLKSIQHVLIRALKMVKMSVTRWAFKKYIYIFIYKYTDAKCSTQMRVGTMAKNKGQTFKLLLELRLNLI